MATGTAATTAREYHQDMVHYVVCPIVYTTLTYNVGILPAGALVVDGFVHVTTGFAGGTPQTIDVGIGSDPDDFATALVITAVGRKQFDELATATDMYMLADTTVTATLSAGATVSAGAGFVVVAYVIANRAL